MKTGWLVIFAGGTGAAARATVDARLHGQGIPYKSVSLDLDHQTNPDVELPIGPRIDPQLHAPSQFGPASRWFAADPRRQRILRTAACGNGAGTQRRVSQFAFEGYRDRISTEIKSGLDDVCAQGADAVQLLFVTSSGGGAGSALTCSTAELLLDPVVRARLQSGHNQSLLQQAPIVFALDPWARVENARHKDNGKAFQALKIESNMYHFRLDIVRRSLQGAIRYACFIGRGVKGVDLGDPLAAERYLGLLVAQYIVGYAAFQGAFVNFAELLDHQGFLDKESA